MEVLTDQLKEQDKELFHLLAKGWTIKAIADKWGVHENTVQQRASKARNSIGAETLVQAVIMAYDAGLFE